MLIITNSDNNKSIYFRYYDPRTLKRFLSCATQNQARKLFGPVQFYLLENVQVNPKDNTIERYWEEETDVQYTPLVSPPQIYFNSPFKTIDHVLSQTEIDWQAQHAQTHQRLIKQAKEQGTTKGRLVLDPAKMQQQRLMSEAEFIEWYVNDYMPEHLPEHYQAIEPKDLKEMIKNGRNQAIQLGFTIPVNQTHFITLMWKIGANFYDTPAFKHIAQNNKHLETERIEQFYNVNDDDWDEAVQQVNQEYWKKEGL